MTLSLRWSGLQLARGGGFGAGKVLLVVAPLIETSQRVGAVVVMEYGVFEQGVRYFNLEFQEKCHPAQSQQSR